MQTKRESTTRSESVPSVPASARPAPAGGSSTKPTTPRESAFSALFLERAQRREAEALSSPRPGPGEGLSETPIARRARWSGPWAVERVPAGDGFLHAAVRREEPAAEGGAEPAWRACAGRTRCWARRRSRRWRRRTCSP